MNQLIVSGEGAEGLATAMLYRSPWTRGLFAAMGLLAGLLLIFGDPAKWRGTPSMTWLAQLPIPLQAWGVGFILYAALLLPLQTRPTAYALGAFLYAVFGVSLLVTVGDGGPKNIVAIVALVDTIVFHIYAIRTAEAIRLERRGGAR